MSETQPDPPETAENQAAGNSEPPAPVTESPQPPPDPKPEREAPEQTKVDSGERAKSAESTAAEAPGEARRENESQRDSGSKEKSGEREHQDSGKPQESAAPDNRSEGDQSHSGGESPKPEQAGTEGRPEAEGKPQQQQRQGRQGKGGGRQQRNRRGRKDRRKEREQEREREAALLEAAPAVEMEGLIEVSPKGFGFLRQRERNYQQSPEDVFITPEVVRIHGLRDGVWVKCLSKQGVRGPQLTEVIEINGREPEAYHNLPYFEELTAINPNKRLKMETTAERYTTRVIDLMTPIGRGQRGLIVAPPRTGKTTLLHHMAEAILENYEDEHLMVMLIDERPEEVTDFKRSFPEADIFASSNDSDVKSHTRMAQLAIERAKRLVEAGENVFILLDSITRMARAFNNSTGGGKKRGTQSGGIAVGALEIPRRLFAAARNTREAGALTIIATALIQTNSRMDEAIFQEFKGTGNMELVLDRQLSQNYVYPSVDIHKSGTRREELLLPGHQLEKIHVIRRGLAGYKPLEAMEWMLNAMKKYPGNAQMLMDIKTSAVA